MRFNVNESFVGSRFHVIVTIQTEKGTDRYTDEWFSRKQPAIDYATRLLAILADDSPEDSPNVIVYDSQGPRDESRRITQVQLAVPA